MSADGPADIEAEAVAIVLKNEKKIERFRRSMADLGVQVSDETVALLLTPRKKFRDMLPSLGGKERNE